MEVTRCWEVYWAGLNYFHKWLFKHKICGELQDYLLEIVTRNLIRATAKFDPLRNVKPSTYGIKCVRWALSSRSCTSISLLHGFGGDTDYKRILKRIPAVMKSDGDGREFDHFECNPDVTIRAQINEMDGHLKRVLTPKEWDIMYSNIVLGETLKEISIRYNCSRQNIENIHKRSLSYVRALFSVKEPY